MTYTILLQKCFVVFFIFEKGQIGSEKEQQERQGTDQQSMSLKSLPAPPCVMQFVLLGIMRKTGALPFLINQEGTPSV